MTKNKAVNDLLAKVQDSLKSSDDAIESSNAFLEKLEKDKKKSDEEYEGAQAAVDKDIEKIVKDIDEATVQFVADTE